MKRRGFFSGVFPFAKAELEPRSDAYARAVINTQRDRAAAAVADPQTFIRSLDGEHRFELGAHKDAPVWVSASHFATHGYLQGASGHGKSFFLIVIAEALERSGVRVNILDPKAETVLVFMEQAAMRLLSLPDADREAFASRYRLIDVQEDRITPANLFALPDGMNASLLADLRTAAFTTTADHAFSDYMTYGVKIIVRVCIALQRGLTSLLGRRIMLDRDFRIRDLAPKIADTQLRDNLLGLEETMPETSRKAVVRQVEMFTEGRTERVLYGLGPNDVAALTHPSDARVILGNFGASLQRSPALAIAQGTNHIIDTITAAMVRPPGDPEEFIVDEIGSLVRQKVVARYLIEGSRTLRWKNFSIVACGQDPANAIPEETRNALFLNAQWVAAFQSAKEDASLLLPFFPAKEAPGDPDRQRRLSELMSLPKQIFYFVKKGSPPLKLRTRNVPLPRSIGKTGEELRDIFMREIGYRSMVRLADAERLVAEADRDIRNSDFAPSGGQTTGQREAAAMRSVDDLLALINAKRRETKE